MVAQVDLHLEWSLQLWGERSKVECVNSIMSHSQHWKEGSSLMYRYAAEHTGVAEEPHADRPPKYASFHFPLCFRHTYNKHQIVRGYTEYRCNWVSERLNFDDYGASKSSPAIIGEWIYIGTDVGTLAKVSRLDGHVCFRFSGLLLLSLILKPTKRWNINTSAGGQGRAYMAHQPSISERSILGRMMATCTHLVAMKISFYGRYSLATGLVRA
jgi:hypothetical protein